MNEQVKKHIDNTQNKERKMRILVLYGVNCTIKIWENMKPYFADYEVDYVEYPHEVTERAIVVDDITTWVYENYFTNSYDVVIGHSLGGVIALQLVADYKMQFEKIIYLDTNLKPAEVFYRNLMMPEHMEEYGEKILKIFEEERPFYRKELLEAIQGEFDYTECLQNVPKKVYAIYGNRGVQDYPDRISDLNLPDDILHRLEFRFVPNSCHMMMIENPQGLSAVLKDIIPTNSNLSTY